MSAENRKFARREANRPAFLMIPKPCTLVDISRGGALLAVEHPASLPDEFLLELRAGLTRWCRVVRRDSDRVGVQFIEPPIQWSKEDAERAPTDKTQGAVAPGA